MAWSSGHFDFPTSTGAFSVTGLTFRPQGAFFICSNFAALDVATATPYPTLGFGMVWLDYLTGLPDSQCVTNVMGAGINVKPDPIVMTDALGCTEEYAASFTSFNNDGFTLDVTDAAPGVRPVTWMVFGGYDVAGGSANLGSAIYTIGQKILTGFAMNYRTDGGIRDGCETARYTSLYIGAASFPTVDSPPGYNSRSWGSSGTSYFPVTGAQGFTRNDYNINPSPQFESAINISTGDFPPIVLEDRIQFWRLTDTQFQTSIGGGPLRWMVQWIDAENWNNSFEPDVDVGDHKFFVSGNGFLDQIEGAIYTGLLGAEAEGLGAQSRMSIGFLTADAQGCVGATQAGYAFQSQTSFCLPNLDATGALAASGVIDGDTIDATTEINDGFIDTASGGIFCWGPPAGEVWLPQIYRRWRY